MFVYVVGLGIWFFAVIVGRHYPVRYEEKQDEKQLGKKYLYPVSSFLMDVWIVKSGFYHEEKIEQALREVYVKEDIQDVKYRYFLKKTANVFGTLGAILFLGLVISCMEIQEGKKEITSIKRADPGMGDTQYQFRVETSDKQEEVTLSIAQKEYTLEEKQRKVEEAFSKLEQEILGENKSLEHVTSDLNLVSGIGEVEIFWEIEEEEKIDISGELISSNIETEGEEVNLKANLSFSDYEEEYMITVRLYPEGKEEGGFSGLLQEIEKQNSTSQQDVVLPDTWEGEKVTFYPIVQQYAVYIGVIGLLLCVVLFFAQDRDTYEQVKIRENQMMLDYGEIVSKLSLFYQAGMTITGAWERIIQEYEGIKRESDGIKKLGRQRKNRTKRYAYEEMKITWQQIKDGKSVSQSMGEFGRRCRLTCYLKLGNLLEQNIHKGAKGLVELLETEMIAANELRKDVLRKKGEEAGVKLLIPMIGMLGISIVIIVVPSLMSMDF